MRVPESVRRAVLEVGYRVGGWPRRVAAVACLALAVVTALHDRPGPTERATPVVVAAHDLAAGTVLRPSDVELADWPPGQIPSRALRTVHQVVGVAVAAAMDRGEPVTAARMRGPGITAGLAPGLVAATVTIANSNTLTFVRPGDRVDLLAAIPADVPPTDDSPTTTPAPVPSTGKPAPAARPSATSAPTTAADGAAASARVVASGVRVLAVVSSPSSAADGDSAGLVVAVNRSTALAIASVIDGSMTATLRMPP
jgi:Flp pilus assembly protein CpaB